MVKHDDRQPLTPQDIASLAGLGITAEEAHRQLAQLRRPVVPITLVRPCTINDGIEVLSSERVADLIAAGDAAATSGRVMKFVPASGAATRMFKDLIASLHGIRQPSSVPAVREFFARLDEFPFSAELRRLSGVSGEPTRPDEERRLLRTLLTDMRFAELPKALIPFHYVDRPRTALEEQLLEATRYTRDAAGRCRVHFTVPADRLALFDATLAAVRPMVEAHRRGAVIDVTLSTQSPSTDTLALDVTGAPFRNEDGSLLLRPAGHGALLRNLAAVGGDIVVVKNIDNIVPDEASAEVVRWKRALIGYLATVQAEVFEHVRVLSTRACPSERVEAAATFALRQFGRVVAATESHARRLAVLDALDRPLRVCGFVRNEGEPGGAPFWVRDADGRESIQIVESAQVDLNDPAQALLFRQATHFNPVDLVCGLRSADGRPFDLDAFVDDDTAFVTKKSADGRDLIALERPGLWNGAMAGWNTVCVDVPAGTFAPVKTIFDLLRPQHQFSAPRWTSTSQGTDLSGRVLVIDDQALNTRLLRQILERVGLRVLLAGDGEQGMALARSEPVDLILLDIVLPGLDGYEVLARLRSEPATADIPVILISALNDVSDKVRGWELGAADYVTKPFDPREVIARVRAQLRIRNLTTILSQANERLMQREQILLDDLRAAAEVQKSLLPTANLSTDLLRSAWVFEPSLAIGGDIFNVIQLPDGTTVAFVADVSGHGVASALLTMSLAQWLSSVDLTAGRAQSPASLLTSLERDYPFERFGKYFSIVIACICADGRRIRYSAAGHPEPLLIRQSGEVERLDSGGPVIGMGFGLAFDEGECQFERGDRLVLYTDGVVEDVGSDGARFGISGLAEAFVGGRDRPLADVCGGLATTLRKRRGDTPAADDIALLALERY